MFAQFLLIAGGSTGALPLSGVALPLYQLWGLLTGRKYAGCQDCYYRFLPFVEQPFRWSSSLNNRIKILFPPLLSASIAVLLLTVNGIQIYCQQPKMGGSTCPGGRPEWFTHVQLQSPHCHPHEQTGSGSAVRQKRAGTGYE
jgi:hypothetical protein